MLSRLRMSIRWARARFASVVFASIGLYAAWLTMRQSYYFGHGLGITEVGRESYAQWLTLADVATATLPIAAVVMWRRGSVKTCLALSVATVLFVAFTITNQMGFGASERLGQSARIAAINKAAADAKAEQQALIKGQIKWNNNSITKQTTTRSSRKENIASTERLIANAGTIDPDKVYSAPTDIQAASLVSLVHRWTPWTVDIEGMALFLVASIAILGTLMKPIFLGLATYFYPEKQQHDVVQAAKAKREDKDDRPDDDAGLSLAPYAPALTETPARAEPSNATVHASAIEVASATIPTAGGEPEPAPTCAIENAQEARPAIMAAVAAREASEDQAEVETERPRAQSVSAVSVPSVRDYMVTPKSERKVLFKTKDTREHARLTDGHLEAFVETLIGYVPNGESIPFKSSVWEKYRQFCAEENLRPMHDKALSNALGRFGILRHRPTGGSVYLKLPDDLASKIAASRQFFAKDEPAHLATAH